MSAFSYELLVSGLLCDVVMPLDTQGYGLWSVYVCFEGNSKNGWMLSFIMVWFLVCLLEISLIIVRLFF